MTATSNGPTSAGSPIGAVAGRAARRGSWSSGTSATYELPACSAATRSGDASSPTTSKPDLDGPHRHGQADVALADDRARGPCARRACAAGRRRARRRRRHGAGLGRVTPCRVGHRLTSCGRRPPRPGAEPRQRAGEAVGEADRGRVAEVAAGRGDVGVRVADVAGARRPTCSGVTLDAELVGEDAEQVEQRRRLAPGDVERPPGAAVGGRRAGAQVGLHRVGDEREVAALQAVAVHLGACARSAGRR